MRHTVILASTTLSTYALSLLFSSAAMAASVHVEVPVVRPKAPSVVVKPNIVVVKPGSVLRSNVVNRTAVIHDHDLRSTQTRQDSVKGGERISTETEIPRGVKSAETVSGGDSSSTSLSPTMAHWISGHYTSTIARDYGKSGVGVVEDWKSWDRLTTLQKVAAVISPAGFGWLQIGYAVMSGKPIGSDSGGGGGAPSGGKAVNTVEEAKTESGSGGITTTTWTTTTTTETVTKTEGGGGGGGTSGGPPVNTVEEAKTVSGGGATTDSPSAPTTPTTNANDNPKTEGQ